MCMLNRRVSLNACLVLVLGSLSFSGCNFQCRNQPGGREYRELSKLYSDGNLEPRRRFSSYSIDQQIDIYLYSRKCADDTRIEPLLIADGERKIDSILRRTGEEPHLPSKGYLVSVLIRVNTFCRCISRDSNAVQALERIGVELDRDPTISSNDVYKQIYHGNVKSLKTQLDDQ